MSNNLLAQFLTLDDELQDAPSHPQQSHSFLWPPAVANNFPQVKVEDSEDVANWSHLIMDSPSSGTASSLDYDDPSQAASDIPCIPGGLSQISSIHSDSRSPSPDMAGLPGAFFTPTPQLHQSIPSVTLRPATIAFNQASLHHTRALSPPVVHRPSPSPAAKSKRGAPAQVVPVHQPHPYSISPSNTTALFTRASSVSSNPAPNAPVKKSRAPPSGPISTKDFIPPDVSGLTKREARLVKNRAAAFLSRQRKREEFECLEQRVEVLEADNARLQQELDSYRSGDAIGPNTASSSAPNSAVSAELAALKRQLASRDAELAKMSSQLQAVGDVHGQLANERSQSAQKDAEIAELKRRLASSETPAVKREEDCDESDSEDAQSTVGGKKDLKSAGSMAFMVLLFSLSTLLTNASNESAHAKPPKASQPVRRPGFHRRSDSNLGNIFPDTFNVYDSFAAPSSLESMMLSSPSFGYDEDTLMGNGAAPSTSTLSSGGLSAASAFAGLTASSAESLQRATGSSISSVKSLGPNEFEFDFDVPSASGSSSAKKIGVRVKSALPLDLDLSALNKAASNPAPSSSSSGDVFASTLPSPFEFRPDDDLDFSWAAGPPATPLDSKKRKRVLVEIKPNSSPRSTKRRVSAEADDLWDVQFSEDFSRDEDVMMRS